MGEVSHPRAAECVGKVNELKTSGTQLKALKGNIVSIEAKATFDRYVATFTGSAANLKAQARKRAADTFLTLAKQFTASPKWFSEQFAQTTESVVAKIGGDRLTETNDELDVITTSTKPDFSIVDLPFDLESRVEAASNVPANIEITGRQMTATEFERELAAATEQLLKEKRDVRNETPLATAAVTTVQPVRTETTKRAAWKAPRTS